MAELSLPAPSPDRAPDWVAGGTPEPLRGDLIALLDADRVLARASDLVRYASDASPYRRIPKAVVQPRSEEEVAKLLAYGRRTATPIVFRAGGTSLNGQAQTDGILVDVRRNWRGLEVLDDGARIRLRPGVILGHANRALAPYARKLGPDPASTEIATVGGVIANNSGGMRCGTTRDSYSTLSSLSFVLASGTRIDTAEADAEERFAAAEPELYAGLADLRDEIRADADLRNRISRKFAIKNTTGYRLCAFLDADEPLEIFAKLLIGSEGTLAFISEAVLETVPVPPLTTLAWIHFASIDAACARVPELVAAGASAVELMVAPALMVAANSIAGTPEYWKELDLASAALLVELPGESSADLDAAETRVADVLADHELLRPVNWARDARTIEIFWTVREGMHGLVGRLRAAGTALIVEDVCVPPERIADCAADLQALLGEHGFLTGVAGHASAGNLHFMLTPDFAKPEDVERYESFIGKLVELILETYDGSLKAEHGTGVNMAPFLEREWGPRATELMWRIKQLADPDRVLAPGVQLNRDPECHLQDLKTTPEVEESVTSCVECGFCEPVCPSRDLTTTPRQRIVLRREMARQPLDSPVRKALSDQYTYDGLETCAADGSCAIACPLGIDTGELVKELRGARHSLRAERTAERVAERWASVERGARRSLGVGGAISAALSDAPLSALSKAARAAGSAELIPQWVEPMPPPAAKQLPATCRAGAAAVYMPACVNRIFGRAHPGAGAASLPEALVTVSARAGKPVWIPADIAGSCCATPWTSKGYGDGAKLIAARTVQSLWRWSDGGELPIVIDASTCAQGLIGCAEGLDDSIRERHAALTVIDSIDWALDHLLAELTINERVGAVALHPSCSSRQLGSDRSLQQLAAVLAEEVVSPEAATCCGFAGDRGFLHPELTEAATAEEKAELAGRAFDAHLCANRTCEIGLERTTGRPYESVVYLLEELTRC